MVKRVHRKKDICSLEVPRFVDFKEAAKLTYDRCVSYFAATLTPYFSLFDNDSFQMHCYICYQE